MLFNRPQNQVRSFSRYRQSFSFFRPTRNIAFAIFSGLSGMRSGIGFSVGLALVLYLLNLLAYPLLRSF